MKRLMTVMFVLFILCSSVVFGQLLSIQGVARNSEGQSLADGSYTFKFRLYDAETGGTAKWNESQTLVVKNGVFSGNLGAVNNMADDNLDFNQEYWLSIEIGSNGEMSPRSKLTLTPYAAVSQINGTSNVFTQDANVGIGTTTPAYKLDVKGQIYAGGGIKVPSSCTVIENSSNGRPIMQTGWSSTYGDYTAISSGYDWDASHEPVSMMASYHGFFVTKAAESGVPFGKLLHQIRNTGDVVHTGSLISKGPTYESIWMRYKEHTNGNATYIGSGGVAAIGAGESVAQVYDNVVPEEENLYLTSDGAVKIITSMQSGWSNRKEAVTIETNADIKVLGGKPIVIRRYTQANTETYTFTTVYSVAGWSAAVIGFDFGYCDIDEGGSEDSWKVLCNKGTTNWEIKVEGHTHDSHPDWTIDVMFIKRQLTDDNR